MKIRWYTVIIFKAKMITKQVFKRLINMWEMGKVHYLAYHERLTLCHYLHDCVEQPLLYSSNQQKGTCILANVSFENLEGLDIHLGSWQFQTMIIFSDCNLALSWFYTYKTRWLLGSTMIDLKSIFFLVKLSNNKNIQVFTSKMHRL